MSQSFDRDRILREGKTKKVWTVERNADLCIVENTDAITANDDPTLTKQMSGKAEAATTTTCRVFEVLDAAGIPTAYKAQLSSREFLAWRCKMIPLECIARRFADGSYLKRHPECKRAQGQCLHRFRSLAVEFFLKTTNGFVRTCDGAEVDVFLASKIDDPLIHNPEDREWRLVHPKLPFWDPNTLLNGCFPSEQVLPPQVEIQHLQALTVRTFLVLERLWAMQGCSLTDFKIELGLMRDGILCVSDVIDTDSWRLRTPDGQELSKQLFRDGHPLSEVAEVYEVVARLTERFRMPKQALLCWRPSNKVAIPEWMKTTCPGVTFHHVVCSPQELDLMQSTMDGVLAQYPDGGVIVVVEDAATMLAPLLASQVSWPVINTMPCSQIATTNLCAPNVQSAFLAAMRILAQSNPAAYQLLRECEIA